MKIRNSEHLQAEQRFHFLAARILSLVAKAAPVSVSAQTAPALVVLVVEDEFFVRTDIADFLREAGYVVLETDSGDDAIALCESGMSIDIVFTDINLAGAASGWDVAERFRAGRPSVSVLYTSGKSIDRQRCIPGSAFVPKPYLPEQIISACQLLRQL